MYSPNELKGIETRGMHGEVSAETALKKLLEGTAFVVRVHPSGAILITRAEESTGTPKAAPTAATSTAATQSSLGITAKAVATPLLLRD